MCVPGVRGLCRRWVSGGNKKQLKLCEGLCFECERVQRAELKGALAQAFRAGDG